MLRLEKLGATSEALSPSNVSYFIIIPNFQISKMEEQEEIAPLVLDGCIKSIQLSIASDEEIVIVSFLLFFFFFKTK